VTVLTCVQRCTPAIRRIPKSNIEYQKCKCEMRMPSRLSSARARRRGWRYRQGTRAGVAVGKEGPTWHPGATVPAWFLSAFENGPGVF
jgi:hypothetical protein